ncbi:MAG: rod shape-determining protein MreD [Bacteroidota bacterium]
MNRINLKEQLLNFTFLLLVQLPLVHRLALFNVAFGFIYVGFLLFLPVTLSRIYLLLIGFCTGLLIDLFSNTPGLHALSCVFLMFIRNAWLAIINDDWKELGNLNIWNLRWTGFLGFIFPLILIHHFLLFIIENGGFHLFGTVIQRIFFSTIFSTVAIFIIHFLMTPRSKRI